MHAARQLAYLHISQLSHVRYGNFQPMRVKHLNAWGLFIKQRLAHNNSCTAWSPCRSFPVFAIPKELVPALGVPNPGGSIHGILFGLQVCTSLLS